MSDSRTTLGAIAAALLLLVATLATAPRVAVPQIYAGRGEAFFPQFTDPNDAPSLELLKCDARTASTRPFKVQNRGGKRTIPSHYAYPTDPRDRLAQTAAAI